MCKRLLSPHTIGTGHFLTTPELLRSSRSPEQLSTDYWQPALRTATSPGTTASSTTRTPRSLAHVGKISPQSTWFCAERPRRSLSTGQRDLNSLSTPARKRYPT